MWSGRGWVYVITTLADLTVLSRLVTTFVYPAGQYTEELNGEWLSAIYYRCHSILMTRLFFIRHLFPLSVQPPIQLPARFSPIEAHQALQVELQMPCCQHCGSLVSRGCLNGATLGAGLAWRWQNLAWVQFDNSRWQNFGCIIVIQCDRTAFDCIIIHDWMWQNLLLNAL